MMPSSALIAGLSVVLLVLGVGRIVMTRNLSPAPRAPRASRPGPVARRPWGRALGVRLQRGGITLSPGAFVGVVAGVASAAAIAVAGLLAAPLLAPAAAGLVGVAAIVVVRGTDRRHTSRVAAHLPETARVLAAALGAGLSLRQALARAARDGAEPLASELRVVVDELALGARIETALEGLVARVPSRDLRVLVTAILVQRRAGGDLARALAVLAERLDERVRLARELNGATAQARLTAWLVAALPLGAGLMAEIASPGTVRRVLGEPPGPLLCLVAGVMYGAGVLWVRRIGAVEP